MNLKTKGPHSVVVSLSALCLILASGCETAPTTPPTSMAKSIELINQSNALENEETSDSESTETEAIDLCEQAAMESFESCLTEGEDEELCEEIAYDLFDECISDSGNTSVSCEEDEEEGNEEDEEEGDEEGDEDEEEGDEVQH